MHHWARQQLNSASRGSNFSLCHLSLTNFFFVLDSLTLCWKSRRRHRSYCNCKALIMLSIYFVHGWLLIGLGDFKLGSFVVYMRRNAASELSFFLLSVSPPSYLGKYFLLQICPRMSGPLDCLRTKGNSSLLLTSDLF